MPAETASPAEACAGLKTAARSVQMATLGADGEPHIGYTPFVFDGDDLIVFVSQLALHTRDLLANGKVAAMLISDEQDSRQIFARTRVSYQCRATVIDRTDPRYTALLDQYQTRHGKTAQLLRQLPDFVLFRLTPHNAQFVMGFGKAYRIEGEAFVRVEGRKRGVGPR